MDFFIFGMWQFFRYPTFGRFLNYQLPYSVGIFRGGGGVGWQIRGRGWTSRGIGVGDYNRAGGRRSPGARVGGFEAQKSPKKCKNPKNFPKSSFAFFYSV